MGTMKCVRAGAQGSCTGGLEGGRHDTASKRNTVLMRCVHVWHLAAQTVCA